VTAQPRYLILLLVCLLLAGVALGAENERIHRTVTVTGTGEISAAPDEATVSMSIQALAPQLDAARAKVTQAVQSFLELTRKLGIDNKYIRTSQLTVQPEYQWRHKQGQQRLTGYFVERQLTVDLRDLDLLGVLIERAVSSGVNTVSGPEFGSSREDELRREALKRAAVDAHKNAEALARSLGARLGLLRHITAGSPGIEPPVVTYAMAKADLAQVGAADTYQTGQIKITAQVTGVFDLVVTP
jgi:uncharacterized protein YggE